MARRLQLQDELEHLLGSEEVNFQPPESIKLKYPCINYSKNAGDTLRADDIKYRRLQGYTIMVISRDPDNLLAEQLLDHFSYCRYVRRFVVDNLYHDILELYY